MRLKALQCATLLVSCSAFLQLAPRSFRSVLDLSATKEPQNKDVEKIANQLLEENQATAAPAAARRGVEDQSKLTLQSSTDLFVKLQFDFGDFVAFAGRGLDTIEDATMHFRR